MFNPTIYGLALLPYLGSQIYFAEKERNRNRVLANTTPPVLVLLPFYNEREDRLFACIQSLLDQDYKGQMVVSVVDDGSADSALFAKAKKKFAGELISFYRQPNQGKRVAQYSAWYEVKHFNEKYVLTVDSDSVLAPDAVRQMVAVAEGDDNIAGVTGAIWAAESGSWLGKLLKIRYWTANMQERASQSWFGQVLCASGPCTLWRAFDLEKVFDDYLNQKFLGKTCTYGDDRHLSNQMLLMGKHIVLAGAAICHTHTPDTVKEWVLQQERWSKSHYRETWWLLTRNLMGIHPFVLYQVFVQLLLPFLLLMGLLNLVLNPSIVVAVSYLITIALASLVRGAYAYHVTKDPFFWASPLYGALHIALVFPIRIISLFTLWRGGWGTR